MEKISFFKPVDTENGFYIETGWTSIGNKIKVPTKESEWKVKGNNILSNKSRLFCNGTIKKVLLLKKN